MKRTITCTLAVVVAIGAWAVLGLQAQGVIVIGTFPTRLPAGPDYATDVLHDPWDMSNPADIGQEPNELSGWNTFAVAGGSAGGTTSAAGFTAIPFLYSGFYNTLNPGRTGGNSPIDTTKYKKLSFRMSSTSAGELPNVQWFHCVWVDPACDPPFPAPQFRNNGSRGVEATVNGFKIWVDDMTAQNVGHPWVGEPGAVNANKVLGFRIIPSTQANKIISFDWVRLTVADNAPGAAMQPITWTGGTATIDVSDTAGGTSLLTIARGVTSLPNSWNYGVLPPGAYTLRICSGSHANCSGFSPATKAFTINTPPSIQVTDPSMTTGEDYATTVLGNAWDMSANGDVQFTGGDNYFPTNPADFAGGMLNGTNTDVGVYVTLLYATNNQKPIDTSKYRYFSLRMRVDPPYDLALGSVGRIRWSSNPFISASLATTTTSYVVFPGLNTYSVDLASLTVGINGGIEPSSCPDPNCNPSPELWTAANKRNLHFTPHEFPGGAFAHAFHVDDVKLTANPVSFGSYTIHFAASDADNDPVTVNLYRDTDLNPTNGRTLIVSGLTAAAAGVYSWNTSSLAVPTGAYYIYAEVTDGVQTTGSYSDAPLVVSTPVTQLSLDAPLQGASVQTPFLVKGWALNAGAATGTGVDAIHVYAFPSGGGAQFLGVATYGIARGDVASAFGLGPRFTNSGFSLTASGLTPGAYQIVAYAHNATTGAFDVAKSASITIAAPVSIPRSYIYAPVAGSSVSGPFQVAGWSADTGAASGTGVDAVVVYAFPSGSATPIFLGFATYGDPRGDVGALFGSQFTNSGYHLAVGTPLAPGPYTLAVYSRSTVSGNFTGVVQTFTRVAAGAVMAVDRPVAGSVPQSFTVAGWAIDRDAPSGTGVDQVAVYAFRSGIATQSFGAVATYGDARGDVATAFGLGPQFTNSGYHLTVNNLAQGAYTLYVYAHSTVTGTWQFRTVTINVP